MVLTAVGQQVGVADKACSHQRIVFLYGLGDDECRIEVLVAFLVVAQHGIHHTAVQEIKQVSKYISTFKGGHGCVRDIIEKVLKVQDKWIFDTSVTSR